MSASGSRALCSNEARRRRVRAIGWCSWPGAENRESDFMEVKAKSKYVRVSSSKMRSLAQAIQGRPVAEAMQIAQFSPRKAGLLIGRTLKSAVANAENNAKIPVDRLRVKEALIEIGPTLKRSWPRARRSEERRV